MPDSEASGKIFNASHARNLAETAWGRPHLGFKTKRFATNRKGANWFECASGAGFIIDGRCLTDEEQQAINAYHQPGIASEYLDEHGAVKMRTNPFAGHYAQVLYKPRSDWKKTQTPIYALNAMHEWALAVLFAGIRTDAIDCDQAWDAFERGYNPSAHEIIELRSKILMREATEAS